MSFVGLIPRIIIGLVITAPSLWYVGKWRVGPEKAKFTDALWISFGGTILNAIIGNVIVAGFGFIIQLIVGLYLIKRYYETDWIDALIINTIAVFLVYFVFFALAVLGVWIAF
jgi:hypothetical protein